LAAQTEGISSELLRSNCCIIEGIYGSRVEIFSGTNLRPDFPRIARVKELREVGYAALGLNVADLGDHLESMRQRACVNHTHFSRQALSQNP
jgi:hypothetical protein